MLLYLKESKRSSRKLLKRNRELSDMITADTEYPKVFHSPGLVP